MNIIFESHESTRSFFNSSACKMIYASALQTYQNFCPPKVFEKLIEIPDGEFCDFYLSVFLTLSSFSTKNGSFRQKMEFS